MRSRSFSSCVACLVALLACRPPQPEPRSVAPDEPKRDVPEGEGPKSSADFGPPSRWMIDGGTIAEDNALPLELDRALREHGRLREDVQDHIVVDLNDDGRLDAVVS